MCYNACLSTFLWVQVCWRQCRMHLQQQLLQRSHASVLREEWGGRCTGTLQECEAGPACGRGCVQSLHICRVDGSDQGRGGARVGFTLTPILGTQAFKPCTRPGWLRSHWPATPPIFSCNGCKHAKAHAHHSKRAFCAPAQPMQCIAQGRYGCDATTNCCTGSKCQRADATTPGTCEQASGSRWHGGG